MDRRGDRGGVHRRHGRARRAQVSGFGSRGHATCGRWEVRMPIVLRPLEKLVEIRCRRGRRGTHRVPTSRWPADVVRELRGHPARRSVTARSRSGPRSTNERRNTMSTKPPTRANIRKRLESGSCVTWKRSSARSSSTWTPTRPISSRPTEAADILRIKREQRSRPHSAGASSPSLEAHARVRADLVPRRHRAHTRWSDEEGSAAAQASPLFVSLIHARRRFRLARSVPHRGRESSCARPSS